MSDGDGRLTFKPQRPARFNFVRDVMARWAANPEALALMWTDGEERQVRRTFAQMIAISGKVAATLDAAGIRRGDTVLVILSREMAWWEVMLGCMQLGAVVCPGTTQLSPEDIGYRMRAAAAAAIVTNRATAQRLDSRPEVSLPKARFVVGGDSEGWLSYEAAIAAAPLCKEIADTAADDPALSYFTSGTTGYPKLAVHGAAYPLGHEPTGRFWLALEPGAVHWNLSDTGWAKAAWSSLFAPWNLGATIFVRHVEGFNAAATLSILERYPITTLCAPPTAYRMLALEDVAQRKFSALKHCVAAGEPLNPEIIAFWKKTTGIGIRDGYGQTETALLCANFPEMPMRAGSMGHPVPGVRLAILDDEGNIAPPDIEGEIAVALNPERPAGLFLGYRDDPERTAVVFRNGWYHTGDRARQDRDGYFWFVGRADDVILSAGYRIGPFEVESALLEHPAVAESAVVSSPDPTRGEVVKAFVILAPGYSGDSGLVKTLQDHVKSVTAPYKYPRKIEFVQMLPKTVSGKIRRKELRDREWGRPL